MTVEQIRKAQLARPFRPFTLRTGDGREYPVPHPDFIYFTPPGRTVVVSDRDGAVDLIDLLLVTSLHFDEKRNGRRARGRRIA